MINIDGILRKKQLSKIETAKRMGLSTQSLYRILSCNPTLDNITKLAAALNVPISELFEQPQTDVINCPHCGGVIKVEKG
jgi:transcriptional regulator with XRE-family HTH domain